MPIHYRRHGTEVRNHAKVELKAGIDGAEAEGATAAAPSLCPGAGAPSLGGAFLHQLDDRRV